MEDFERNILILAIVMFGSAFLAAYLQYDYDIQKLEIMRSCVESGGCNAIWH